MRPEWLWDKDIAVEEIQRILKDPQDEHFVNMAALLLSRNNTPKEIFDQYLEKMVFVQHWARIKRQMRKDAWNDPRIIFWQAVYEKLAADFKEQGIAVRRPKEEKPIDDVVQQAAEMVRTTRQKLGLTQSELAARIGISQQVISRIEKGASDIRLLTLGRIFRFLGEHLGVRSQPMWLSNKISDGRKEVLHA